MENNLITGSYSPCGGVFEEKNLDCIRKYNNDEEKRTWFFELNLGEIFEDTSKPSSSHGKRLRDYVICDFLLSFVVNRFVSFEFF